MKLCKVTVMAWLLLSAVRSFAQEVNINYSKDTAAVNKLIRDSKGFFISNPDTVLDMSLQAKQLAEKAGFKEGEGYALKNMGLASYYKNNYTDAIEYFKQSLSVFQSLHDNVGISNLLNNIGVTYYDRGDDTRALDYYLQSLQYAELAKDKVRILTALNNVGGVYFIKVQSLDSMTKTNENAFNSNFSKALDYYGKALSLSEELNDSLNTGTINVNIGTLYYHKKEDGKADDYFQKSLKAFGTRELRYSAYNARGKLFARQERYSQSLENYAKALKIAKGIDNVLWMVQSLTGLGEVYKRQNKPDSAISYYHQAEIAALGIEANHELRDIYRELALAYANTNDFKSAFNYQTLYTEKNTQVFNDDIQKSQERIQFKSDIERNQSQIAIQDLQIKKQKAFKNALIIGLVLVLIIIIVLFRDYRLKIRTNRLLDKQKMEIEHLLLNILPQEVAHELQSTGNSTPRNYESVSVLFTDFKSFTAHAEKMSPDEVVKELNTCFIAFDDIIEKHNLEKIKTIGDAYMCAGGIPTPEEGHVFRMVKASLEIQDFIFRNNERRKEENLAPWEIRIGINVGPVVAGVVGKKKYAYDIWGSAVNIASRMESNGMPGQINISSSVYEVIKDKYACIYRGKIYAKNVGEIDMYFIDHEIENFDGFKTFEEAETKEVMTQQAPTSATNLLQ